MKNSWWHSKFRVLSTALELINSSAFSLENQRAKIEMDLIIAEIPFKLETSSFVTAVIFCLTKISGFGTVYFVLFINLEFCKRGKLRTRFGSGCLAWFSRKRSFSRRRRIWVWAKNWHLEILGFRRTLRIRSNDKGSVSKSLPIEQWYYFWRFRFFQSNLTSILILFWYLIIFKDKSLCNSRHAQQFSYERSNQAQTLTVPPNLLICGGQSWYSPDGVSSLSGKNVELNRKCCRWCLFAVTCFKVWTRCNCSSQLLETYLFDRQPMVVSGSGIKWRSPNQWKELESLAINNFFGSWI